MAIKVNNTTIIDDSLNITANVGTVDGRNVATDGSSLDALEILVQDLLARIIVLEA
jgi:hypothetical protein